MKIAWYTPFSIHSAIGRFSQLVVRALRERGAEVQIVRSEIRSPALRSVAPICTQEPLAWAVDWEARLGDHGRNYDLVVYNLGDHYENHAYAFQHQSAVPGLSIVHDYSLHHALLHHCRTNPAQHGDYLDHLHAENGGEALDVHENCLKDNQPHRWWDQEIARFPVYRWALRDTLGVVAHSSFYRPILAERTGASTTVIPLAYDSAWEPAGVLPRPAAGMVPHRKLVLLTVGSVNPNKRHQAVIQCLAHSRFLRERLQYRIVGHIEPAQRQAIEHQIESFAHRPEVVITGPVSKERLSQELAQADVLTCLRYPALEGASASVIEGLLTGKPVVVTNTGCYEEIPDSIVYKVDPQHERSELTHQLERILRHYDEAIKRGADARAWARQRHSPEQYAARFLEFAHQVLYDRPVLAIADRIAEQLRGWNVPPHPQLLRRVDDALRGLFAEPLNQQRAGQAPTGQQAPGDQRRAA